MTLEKALIQRLANAIRLEGNCPSLPLISNDSHKKVAHDTASSIAWEVEQFLSDFAGEDLAKGFASECVRDS